MSDLYVVDSDGCQSGDGAAVVVFGHQAEDTPTLKALLLNNGQLVDADTLEAFNPTLELDLQRALASYFVDFDVL